MSNPDETAETMAPEEITAEEDVIVLSNDEFRDFIRDESNIGKMVEFDVTYIKPLDLGELNLSETSDIVLECFSNDSELNSTMVFLNNWHYDDGDTVTLLEESVDGI